MNIDTTILSKVGSLTLHVVLTAIPLALCVAHFRSGHSHFLQRRIGVLPIRPGAKYLHTTGIIACVLSSVLSIPRLAAVGILRVQISSVATEILSVLSTLLIHGHIFRALFLGHQYSHFLNGRPRCGRRWRPLFVVLMALSVLVVSTCHFLGSVLDTVMKSSHNPCTMGMGQWWDASVIACAGIATIACAFQVRKALLNKRHFFPLNFRMFLAVLASGFVKLACAAFTWKSDMYPLSNQRDIVFAETIHLRREFLPLIVAYLVLTESLIYAWQSPPQADVRLENPPTLVRLKEWLQLRLSVLETEKRKKKRRAYLARSLKLTIAQQKGDEKGSGNRRKSARWYPHLYPHARCDAEHSRSRDDSDRRSLPFARTVRGEFSGCGALPLTVRGGDVVRNVNGSYVPNLYNLATHNSAFGNGGQLYSGERMLTRESKENIFEEHREMPEVSLSSSLPGMKQLYKNEDGKSCLGVGSDETDSAQRGDPNKCRNASGNCTCHFHKQAMTEKLLPSTSNSQNFTAMSDFDVNLGIRDQKWVEIGKESTKQGPNSKA